MALLRSRMHFFGWRRALAAPLLLLAVSACQPPKAQEGHGLLPPAPADQVTSAAPAPAAPFDQSLGKAAFARTVFRSPGPSNTEITVRDAIVAPHADAQLAASAGPVLIDLQAGGGTVDGGGKSVELDSLHPAAFPAGAAVTLKNTGDVPLVVRLYTLEGK
jgi:hypothetical protein